MLLGYHYGLRQQAKLLAKEKIEIQKRKDSEAIPLIALLLCLKLHSHFGRLDLLDSL
jgi:hypothetical protein